MLEVTYLIEACKNLGLNPKERGDNKIEATSRLCSAKKEPFDFNSIGFPIKELNQVLKIGEIINNLISQTKLFGHYGSGKSEEKAKERDLSIERILPILEESLTFWLEKGIKKCKGDKILLIHNGIVYEEDPEYQKSIDEMNERMEEVHEDYIRKSNASWNSARDIILD